MWSSLSPRRVLSRLSAVPVKSPLKRSRHGPLEERDVRLVAVALVGVLFGAALILAWRRGDLARHSTDILISIVVAIAITFILEWSPRVWGRILESREHREFAAFFGSDAIERPLLFVFSERYFKDDPQWVFTAHSPKYADARHSRSQNTRYLAEGVDHWFAKQDVQGAVEIAQTFAAHSRHSPAFVLESKVDEGDLINGDKCIISIGLGFNSRTAILADQCLGQLFHIAWGKSPNREFPHETDLLTFREKLLERPSQGLDYALVARVVIKGRPHFVCAGRTAEGTAVAGHHLAECWKSLAARYHHPKRGGPPKDLSRDSLAVLLTHRVGSTGAANVSTGRVIDEHWWPLDEKAQVATTIEEPA